MQTQITGLVYVLGDNIDTDQIIPAKYLSYNPADDEERKYFGMYANSGVPEAEAGLPEGNQTFVPEGEFKSKYKIIVGGKNFGCGSSREHAPLALAEAGIECVLADFYARIFYRNSINGGYLLPLVTMKRIVEDTRTGDTMTVDIEKGVARNETQGWAVSLEPLGDVLPIVEAGGVFEYARQNNMIA